jgi:hypothetical protein
MTAVCGVGLDNTVDRVYSGLVVDPRLDGRARVSYIGSGLGLAALRPALQVKHWQSFCQGEGPGRFDEGVVFRVSSMERDVTGVPGIREGGLSRCVSNLLMHLSLSLSLRLAG